MIAAMTDPVRKAGHIPFRNSTLTHVLKNALSGSAKTLMFVNVSPSTKHHAESLSTVHDECRQSHGASFKRSP